MPSPTGRPETPFRLNLEQQKKRARELLRGLRSGDDAATARLLAHHPKQTRADQPKLADAQFVIARELGSPSWARLKTHIEALDGARAAIASEAPPDGGQRTLHIRCGSDIRSTLREAGFTGDFLEYSNPYCQGPVPAGSGLTAVRTRFILEAYGGPLGLTEAGVADRLRQEEDGLAAAATDYERVVLWFEHDSYDQLILARCLAQFAEHGAPRRLELVSINHFPGAARFIGLGQLPPEALRLLWPARSTVGPAELAAGRRAWDALRSDDPRALASLAATETHGLPDLARALRRHLSELPWVGDGLSLTERLVLQLIEGESPTAGRLFSRLMREREPLPWLGDIMFLALLEAMAKTREPALTLDRDGDGDGDGRAWSQWRVAITPAGRAVLRGERDALSLGPPERWVGGVRLALDAPPWRWNDAEARPTLP